MPTAAMPAAAVPTAVMPAAFAPGAAPIVVTTQAGRARFGWLLASLGWVMRTAILLGLVAGLGYLAVQPVLREAQRIDVELLPLSVPAALADAGMTPEVAAARLLDALDAVVVKTMETARIRPAREEMGPIPAIGVTIPGRPTLRSLASALREVEGRPLRRITGEVVALPDNRLAVRLRVPGANQIASAEGAPGEGLDAVLVRAAPEIWRRLNPMLYAWGVADSGEPEAAIRPRLVAVVQELRLPPTVERAINVLYIRSLVRSGRSEEALARLEPLERAGLATPMLFNVKAQALADQGRTEAALEAQRRAVLAEGTTVWSHISSAHLLMRMGRPREALTDLQSARRLQPNNFDAVLMEGMALLSLGRPAEGLALVARVAEARPKQAGVNEAMGNALLANNRAAEALIAFEAELASNPRATTARIGRITALRALRRPAEALVAVEEVLAASPRDLMALNQHGAILVELGRHDAALEVFEDILKRRADEPGALFGRGMALAALGRRPEAIGVMARLVEIQPSNRRAVVELARLRGVPPPPLPPAPPPPGGASGQPAPGAAPARPPARP
jgi:tetratricopeptide (TPR) repeat protein